MTSADRSDTLCAIPSTNSTDFSQRKQYDNNPRYKYDNILSMDLDAPEKTTQEFQGS